MIRLDTTVTIRFLTQDDPDQSVQANALFANLTEEALAYPCRAVMLELVWVLESAYSLPRADIAEAVDQLLASREIVVETANRVGLVKDRYRQSGPRFSGHRTALAADDAGWGMTYSFDRKAISRAGMASLGAIMAKAAAKYKHCRTKAYLSPRAS